MSWFEIISENYLVDGGQPLHLLARILEQYKVVQHGVGLYIGSAQGVSREHLRRLKALAHRTSTPWVTDHLSWGSVDGTFSHDLLPLPYTTEVAQACAENIRQIRDTLERPFAVENVSSYAEYRSSAMTEWEFLTEVVERADCGILLDVNRDHVERRAEARPPLEVADAG